MHQKKYLLLPILVVLLSQRINGENIQGKSVVSRLNARWPAAPLLLEMSEFMADESPATFWTFVQKVSNWDVSKYTASEFIE